MIRPATPDDTTVMLDIARDTGVFKPVEIEVLREVLTDYHAGVNVDGHRAVVVEREAQVAGFAYFAPAEMTEHTWSLWWIAVSKTAQVRGVGTQLLRHVEDQARLAQARVMFIETSSLPSYEPTRRFYLKHGYEQDAVLRDYYAQGDHMIVFRKLLIEA